MTRHPFTLALGLALLSACGGGEGGSSAPTKKQGTVLAKVGNDVITVEEFKAKLDQQSPFVRARYNTLERKKEFLDNQIRFEVLAQEAMRKGMDKDPEVLETTKKVMVQKLIRQQFDETNGGKDIPEGELKTYYDSHVDDYVKPERVRASQVFFAGEDAKKKGEGKKKAQKLMTDLKAQETKGNANAFADAARAQSEDVATKAIGGDMRYFSKDEMGRNYSPELAEGVFKLPKENEMAVVESPKGVHLVKLTGRQPALDRPFDQVKDQIRQRLFRERRTKDFDEFVKKLREEAKIQIDDAELGKVEPAPAGPGPGAPGMPGMPAMPPPPQPPQPPPGAPATAVSGGK